MILCPDCNGEGQFPIGENYVSHDMAIDAGEPGMEGQSMGIEYVQCERCEGAGEIEQLEPCKWTMKDTFGFGYYAEVSCQENGISTSYNPEGRRCPGCNKPIEIVKEEKT